MKDIIEIFKKARNKKIFLNNEFQELLMKIQSADDSLELEWDSGAGEEWARFFSEEKGTVCMINARIGVAFIRKGYNSRKIKRVIDALEVVPVENYSVEEWRVDLDKLQQTVPEIFWHASQEAVDVNQFSLDDLYYASV